MSELDTSCCIIEGFGDMGSKYASLASDMGLNIGIVTKRSDVPYRVFESTAMAVRRAHPAFYIVTNETANHGPVLNRLAGLSYQGRVLVEKPLCNNYQEVNTNLGFPVYVAYVMRFLDTIIRLRNLIKNEHLTGARFSVGGHLAGWRPGRNYEDVYSSRRELGGGVLRDLSHELDLALFICGYARKVRSHIGNWALNGMDCESWADILLECEYCPAVNIHLDCCDHNPHRICEVNTRSMSITINLLSGRKLILNGEPVEYNAGYDRAFRKQMEAFIGGDTDQICSLREGIKIMKLIHRIENSAKAW